MSDGDEQDRGPENEPREGEDSGAAPESAEREQTAHESGEPPVAEQGTPPGDEQAADEVSSGEGSGSAPAADAEIVPDELRTEVERLMALYPDKRSAIIPALAAVQRRYGWCTPDGMAQAAHVMQLQPAELESVASFYDLFHMEPAGSHRVLVCTNISCWMRGADELLDAVCAAADADRDHAGHGGTVSAAGDIFVSGFECLGACDIAPMVSVDERYYGPLEEGEGATLIEQLRSGSEVLPERALAKRPAAGGPEPEPDPRVAEVE